MVMSEAQMRDTVQGGRGRGEWIWIFSEKIDISSSNTSDIKEWKSRPSAERKWIFFYSQGQGVGGLGSGFFTIWSSASDSDTSQWPPTITSSYFIMMTCYYLFLNICLFFLLLFIHLFLNYNLVIAEFQGIKGWKMWFMMR